MTGDHLDGLESLIAVAEEQSFTRAATGLGYRNPR
jgi:DNA-binding transcriptional LysR family regulator